MAYNEGVKRFWSSFSKEERSQIMKDRMAHLKGKKRDSTIGVKVSKSKTGKPLTKAQKEGAERAGEKLRGRKRLEEIKSKISSSMIQKWEQGILKLSKRKGIGEYYDSLLQGKIWLRSSSEVRFASFLDLLSMGGNYFIWLYEAKRYTIRDDKGVVTCTYCPDFWVIPLSTKDIKRQFGTVSLNEKQVEELLEVSKTKYIVDVKGWFNKSHRTYEKIQKFKQQYPNEIFDIVLDRRKELIEDKYVNEILKQSLERIGVSSKKYGDSYILADMPKEIQEEIYDVFGWFLMSTSRLLRAFKDKVISIDNIFWEQFLNYQSSKHLTFLKDRVEEELKKRASTDL
jgi:hypothetical protein